MGRHLAVAVAAVMLLLASPGHATDSERRYNDGVLAYDRGEHEVALDAFRRLAERGHPGAEFMLGAMYFYGKGVRRNDALAAIWFHKAASKGNANGQLAIGSLLVSGLGVRQDLVKAYTWLTLASSDGPPALRHQAVILRDEAARLMRPDEIQAAAGDAASWARRRSGLTW